ncbi:MAG: response regulator [Planctomycetota bacterium]
MGRNSRRRHRLLLGLGIALLLASVLSAGMAVGKVWARRADAVVIDMAGRQRMLCQRHMKEVLMALRGEPADHEGTLALFLQTHRALREGGPTVTNPATGDIRDLPPAPREGQIRRQLAEESRLMEGQAFAAETLLKSPPGDPARVRDLAALNATLAARLDATVKLLEEHSEAKGAAALGWAVTGAILLLAVCVGAILLARRARRLNRELALAMQHLDAVLESVIDGIIVIDTAGTIHAFNPAAEALFGHEASEVTGRNVRLLMPEPYHSGHDGYLANYLRTGEAKVVGIGREVVGLRKDGSTFPMDLAVSEMRMGDTRMFVGIARDVTARKQASQALARQGMEARLLYQATAMAAGTSSLDEALQSCVDTVCEIAAWPVGHAYLPSEDRTQLVSANIWHLPAGKTYDAFREVTARTPFARGIGLPGRIWESGEPAWIVNAQADENFPRARLCDDLGVKGAFGFPVMIRGEVAAVLEFFADEEMSADPNLLMMVRAVGEQVGRVIERRQARHELQSAKDAAVAASRAKSRFLANMSHELRTPLNAIIGYSEMLEEDAQEAGQEQAVADLKKIQAAGRHLLDLINDVLDLSKIEAGRMELCRETFDLADTLRDVASTVRPLVEQRGNELVLDGTDGAGTMHTDLTRVRQILFNLLSNAAKFTERGRISLSVDRETGDQVVFEVSDTGIGMTKEHLSRAFDPFMQADSSTTRKYGGTGLGLAICQNFCRLLRGEISVTSEEGRGTTFTVRLPAGSRPPDQKAASAPETPTMPATEGDTVLVIDDDASARDLMARVLTKDGFRVVTAAGGQDGIALARQHRPIAITLDVMMPTMDGWAVLAALKQDPELASIPVIMETMVDDQNIGYALGAAEYLVKPIDRHALLDAVRKCRIHLPSSRVLVVEDEPDTGEMVARTLSTLGCTVQLAENGRAALEQMSREPPDVILLDLMMPEMDGFELLSIMRQSETYRSIPVIVFTARDLSEEDRRRLNGGVTKVLKKGSCDRRQLMREIVDLLRTAITKREQSEV